ncbi:dihydrofolate reductase family protein [Nonomuraea sp. SMC257]|uniref:Dihydrofolate reductase family protein n=1 Tax=Nonomuraea montanisoli TaxID=2741721 RepID=A0A7Y6I868_9ACTN|nr:dihydrofolate reductase family protein [Nonomuraea montanisoli]NUW33326.1 dihydrofolate reductase family protein [Nonomuraea montanisoli]
MTKIRSVMAVSVDGFITGRDPGPGHGLGDGGILHDWYWNGDTPSTVVPAFRTSETTRRFIDPFAARVGAVIAGRNSYDDANGWSGGSPHPTAPLFVVSHRPAPPEATPAQHFSTSIEEAATAAREAAGDLDIVLMGGGVLAAALTAGLVDEIVIHQVPVLLGAGRRLFQELPVHTRLSLIEAIPAPDVTHLRYQLER